MTTPLAETTATELLRLYRSGAASPVEATREVLARIDRLNPQLNAFCLVDAESALQQARDSEARWQRGAPMGPLDGVPTSIKDLILTRGWPTRRGSQTVDPAQPWEVDAPATARLARPARCCWARPPRPSSAARARPIHRSPASPATPGI